MRNKKINIIVLAIFILIIGVSIYYIITEPINRGLDLKGGTQIILKPVESEGSEVTGKKLDEAMRIIRDRIDYLGISEPLVTRDTLNNNIVIQLPGVSKSERALEVIGKTAQLEFRILTGTLISRSGQNTEFVEFDPETGSIIYDENAEEVILVDNIYSAMPIKIGVLYTDPATGEIYLMDKDFDPNEKTDIGEDSGKQIWEEYILGKFEYNEYTHEMNLMSVDDNEMLGELLIDSRTNTASLVGPVLLIGNKLSKAGAGYDSNGRIIVSLSFKDEGAGIFEEITRNNIGEQLAIVLDEEIKSAPSINNTITGGDAVIEGINSLDEASYIAEILNIGALPFTLIQEDVNIIGPSLGEDSLNKGIFAGIIGLILIVIFMIIYYRGLGLISTLGLMIYVLVFWGIMAGIGAALTLPGIAGIILTIGMAVDANVIIFARIREEGRKGKSPRIAIGDGFKHASRTIVDANVTTLITAAALFYFGTGPIKGFAVTLALGVGISMAVSLLFTRSILFMFSGLPVVASPGFIGVRKKEEQ